MQGGCTSRVANAVVSVGETAGDAARFVGEMTGGAVTNVCEAVKEISPRRVTNFRPLTPKGKMRMTLHWYTYFC